MSLPWYPPIRSGRIGHGSRFAVHAGRVRMRLRRRVHSARGGLRPIRRLSRRRRRNRLRLCAQRGQSLHQPPAPPSAFFSRAPDSHTVFILCFFVLPHLSPRKLCRVSLACPCFCMGLCALCVCVFVCAVSMHGRGWLHADGHAMRRARRLFRR